MTVFKFLSIHLPKIIIFGFFLFAGFGVFAQIVPENGQEVPEPEVPEDPLGRNHPRGTVRGFLSAVGEQDYKLASQYLNLDPKIQDTEEGENLARNLQRFLDQGGLYPYSRISNEASGFTRDELPTGIDRVGTFTVGGEAIEILVEVSEGPEGIPIWLFSSETIHSLSEIADVEPLIIDRVLPDFLKKNMFGGAAIGQWLALLILAICSFFIAWLITKILQFIILKSYPSSKEDPAAGIIKALVLPIMLIFAGWLFIYITQEVGISIVLRQRFSALTLILGVVAILLLLWRLVGFIGEFSKQSMIKRGNVSGMSIVLFLQRATRVTLLIIGIISVLGLLGINVTAGLAALGIGGIALALGAQKTVENLVGSITLVADQPIRVGDFCQVGDIKGTVERIGMRSTRIRTPARTIVTIPNGEFSSAKIENFAHRDRFLFNPVLNLRYETTPDQIRYLLVELRTILYAHPMVSPDPARIRFIRLGAASLDLEVFSYILANNFDEFLEVQEDLLLRMMDVVESSGSGFAFPSQTIYFAKDNGVSEEKANEVGDKVKKWKEENDLQIPGFDPAKIEDLKNSIPYPPDGSVRR